MSRVGSKVLEMPKGVSLTLVGRSVEIKGPKGTLSVALPAGIDFKMEGAHAHITRQNDDLQTKENHGTTRALIHNAIVGVSKGYEKRLEIVGIGFKAAVVEQGALRLNIGYSHSVIIVPRPGVKISTPDPTNIIIEGTDRQAVGETAATIRAVRKPEPYQGKGIKYRGEHIIRKEGKRAGKK